MPNISAMIIDRDAPGSLQDKLKEEILRRIRGGALRPGDQLPPTRRLAEEIGVHRGTVSAVYEELTQEGVLQSHVGRGTFVAEDLAGIDLTRDDRSRGPFRWRDYFADDAGPSRERDLLADAMARAGSDAISFAGLVPDPALFPTESFRKAINTVLRESGSPLLSYGPPDGHDRFLDFLRDYLAAERGVDLGDRELLVVNGSQQALDLIGRTFLRAGDTVLVENPSYHGAMEIFRGYGARLMGVPVDEHGIVVDGLEEVIARERPKMIYVMPTFQNPTGSCLPRSRRGALVRIGARFEVPVIEDDFDGELYFGEAPPSPLKSYPDSDGVIYIGTPSKMLFPGLRIGWIAAAEPVIAHLSRIKQRADLSGSQLLQAALARFAGAGGLEKHMAIVRSAYAERLATLLEALERHMPSGVTWTRPRGGLSLLVSLPEGLDSSRLLEENAGEGVLYSPGRLFFINDGARYLRLSYGNVPTEDVEEGVKRMARVFSRAVSRSRGSRRRRDTVSLPPV